MMKVLMRLLATTLLSFSLVCADAFIFEPENFFVWLYSLTEEQAISKNGAVNAGNIGYAKEKIKVSALKTSKQEKVAETKKDNIKLNPSPKTQAAAEKDANQNVSNEIKLQVPQGDVKAVPIKLDVPITFTISFAGDCTLGEFLGMGYKGTVADYYDRFGPEWFFANVKPIFIQDDLTFVNLEGPLTKIPQQVVKQFPIKGDVRNVNALVKGSIEVCNLANNHIWDCGDAGLLETEKVLKANGIYYCGGTENCVYLQRKGVKLAFLGFHGWNLNYDTQEVIKQELAKAKDAGAELIIAQFHWGNELEYTHNYTQEVLAHLAIDCGADIVIGGHPHVLQDTEYYKGKLICYSMGNFSFGANFDPWDKDTVILQQTFVKKDKGFEYGETKFIPCCTSSTNDFNDYKPTPYTEKSDLNRVRWKLNLK